MSDNLRSDTGHSGIHSESEKQKAGQDKTLHVTVIWPSLLKALLKLLKDCNHWIGVIRPIFLNDSTSRKKCGKWIKDRVGKSWSGIKLETIAIIQAPSNEVLN